MNRAAPKRERLSGDQRRIDPVKDRNLDRLMLDSDSSPKLSDALSVPKAVHEARKLGVNDKDIQKVVWDNPVKFYNLPI